MGGFDTGKNTFIFQPMQVRRSRAAAAGGYSALEPVSEGVHICVQICIYIVKIVRTP